MCKKLSIVALIVSVVLLAALVPSTSQAFLGPLWTPFSPGWLSGRGHNGCGGGYACEAYGGYGYYGSPYGVWRPSHVTGRQAPTLTVK
jgi:hypothetical protein